MTIVKRLVKGSELTHAELDGNFTDLDTRLSDLEAAVSGRSGKILQVVSATKRDVFTTTSTSFTDVPGLFVTLTPSSSTSKILIMASVVAGIAPPQYLGFLRLERDDDPLIAAGDAAGSRIRVSTVVRSVSDANHVLAQPIHLLDAPGVTRPVTYKITARVEGGLTLRINASGNDVDQPTAGHRSISTITAFEVAG